MSEANHPTKIAWDQPEDDIPSEEDVIEVLMREQRTEIGVENIQNYDDQTSVGYSEIANREFRIDSSTEWDDRNESSREQLVEMPVSHKQSVDSSDVSYRIKPITIDWELAGRRANRSPSRKSATPKRAQDGYVPTILGAGQHVVTAPSDQENPVLSDYYSYLGNRFTTDYRSPIAILGVLALISLFIFGGDIMGSYSTSVNSDEVYEMKTGENVITVPQTIHTVELAPNKENSEKDGSATVTEKDLIVKDRQESPHAIPGSPITKDTVRMAPSNYRVQNTPEKPAETVRKNEKAPKEVTDNLKSKQEKKSAESKDTAKENTSEVPTRPRIVKDPKP